MKALDSITLLAIILLSSSVNSQVYNSESYNNYENHVLHHRNGPYRSNQFSNELEDIFNTKNDESSFIPMKIKKDQYNPEPPTCMAKFKYEHNVIVDSKASIRNGAELLTPIRYISQQEASASLNALQDKCMKLCCDSSKCDTALLSMKIGQDGYRCYLFKCSGNCFFVKHNEYVVLRMRSSEQLSGQEMPEPEPVSTTKTPERVSIPKIPKSKCHHQYEFTCKSTGTCIPTYDVCNSFNDCEDKSDEATCTTNSNIKQEAESNLKTTTLAPIEKLPSYDLFNDDKNYLNIQDDYDIYSLIQKQKNAVDHLNELEQLHLKLKDPGLVKEYETPKDFLDSFFITNPPARATRRPVYVPTTRATLSYKPTKFYWNDNFNSEMMSNHEPNDKNYLSLDLNEEQKIQFTDKSNAVTPGSNISLAIFFLIAGISIVIMLFSYLFLSTKFIKKRLSSLKNGSKNVDVDGDGDYLINGMYL